MVAYPGGNKPVIILFQLSTCTTLLTLHHLNLVVSPRPLDDFCGVAQNQ